MTTTVYNSKDIKYIWSTSDDDGLTSMTFLSEDDIIYAVMCAYNEDNTDMEYIYYKSTDTTNNKALWNQLMLDDLENFGKYFKVVTDEVDIGYMSNKKGIYQHFVNNMCHDLGSVLSSMIIALYTSITNETSVPDNILHIIYDDVIDMLGVNPLQPSEDALVYVREYSKESLFATPILLYRENQYKNVVSDIIKIIKDIYA